MAAWAASVEIMALLDMDILLIRNFRGWRSATADSYNPPHAFNRSQPLHDARKVNAAVHLQLNINVGVLGILIGGRYPVDVHTDGTKPRRNYSNNAPTVLRFEPKCS